MTSAAEPISWSMPCFWKKDVIDPDATRFLDAEIKCCSLEWMTVFSPYYPTTPSKVCVDILGVWSYVWIHTQQHRLEQRVENRVWQTILESMVEKKIIRQFLYSSIFWSETRWIGDVTTPRNIDHTSDWANQISMTKQVKMTNMKTRMVNKEQFLQVILQQGWDCL